MDFYNNFLKWCERVHKKPSTVAEEAGLSRSQVTRWKHGQGFTDASAMKLANYFGITLEEFLKEEEENSTIEIRNELRDSYAYRILNNTLIGATEADMLEAAALVARRKEERNGK